MPSTVTNIRVCVSSHLQHRFSPVLCIARQQAVATAAHDATRDAVPECAASADHFIKAEPTGLYPLVWLAELKRLVTFEFGKMDNNILEGDLKEEDVESGKISKDISSLLDALIPKTRAAVKTKS